MLLPSSEGPKVVAVLSTFKACFDDSGTDSGQKVCIAAGFIASTSDWDWFDRRWNEALPKDWIDKISGKPCFHAEEHLSKRDAVQKVEPLLQAIDKSLIYPIAAAVDVKAFNSYTEEERRYLTGALWNGSKRTWTFVTGSPNQPFLVPFIHVVALALDRTPDRPTGRVHFWFDRNNNIYGYMRDLYSRWKNWTGPAKVTDDFVSRMGDIGEGSRCDHPSLQAADLLAYCGYHFARHEMFGEPVRLPAVNYSIYRFGQFARAPRMKFLDKEWLDKHLTELPQAIRDGSADTRKAKKSGPLPDPSPSA